MGEVLYNQHINKVTPHFTFMRWAQNADIHALKDLMYSLWYTQTASAVQKNFLCASFVLVIASNMHLESESEKRAENIDLHTAKNIQKHTKTFPLFLDEFFITWPLAYLP